MKGDLPFTLEQIRALREVHPTPFYIYNAAGIAARVEALKSAFSWNPGFREYFAVKACPTPAILRLLADAGCGADCASIPELMLAEASGMRADRVMFSSNETSDAEFRHAVQAGAHINLDDITQIEHLERVCGIPDSVCCRYNPGEFELTGDIMGHLHDSKFGMTSAQIFEAFEILRDKGVKRFGIHAMLASCCLDAEYYPRLAAELFGLILELRNRLGITVSFVDMAGGIGIPYRPDEKPVDIAAIGAEVHAVYDELLTKNGVAVDIFTELGRYITGPCGYLVTSVIGHKHIYKEYVGVDSSACDLMRPAIYGAYHHITVLGKENSAPAGSFDVVGSLCENNDKFAVDRALPQTDLGDILVIHDAGAHGRSMGYNYNGKLRCAELMMNADGTFDLIRRAETPADYFATLDVDENFTTEHTEHR